LCGAQQGVLSYYEGRTLEVEIPQGIRIYKPRTRLRRE
jgi:hypothetical protein